MTLDNADRPHVAYYDVAKNRLKYAAWNGSDWAITGVASAGGLNFACSVAVDSGGIAHIAFRDNAFSGPRAVKYARKTGSTWDVQIVAPVEGATAGIALAADGTPRVVYDSVQQGLQYARLDGTSWVTEPVDSGWYHEYAAIKLGSDGVPHVAFYDSSGRDVKYGRRTESGWQVETVDALGDVGRHLSMVLDSAGHPHVSYLDVTTGKLKYAHWQAD
jgi:hypothetical protein